MVVYKPLLAVAEYKVVLIVIVCQGAALLAVIKIHHAAEIAERLVAPDDIQQQMFVPNVRRERRSLQHLQRIIRIGIGLQIRYRMGVHPQRIRRNAPVIPRKHLTAYVYVSGDIIHGLVQLHDILLQLYLDKPHILLDVFSDGMVRNHGRPRKSHGDTEYYDRKFPQVIPRPEFIEKFSHCCNTES